MDNADPLPHGKRSDSAFLKDHMHGVVSVLNDSLQDIRYKLTVETKQAIMRGYGSFIQLVGKDINPVGPQVCYLLPLIVRR